MRGVFALAIFLHHFYPCGDGKSLFPAGGDCGVAFFFMLSGFVLCAGYAKRVEAGTFACGRYLVKRLARIYPLHLLCLCWAVAIAGWHMPKLAGVLNLLLLQSWLPVKDIYFSGNAVAWCLSDLLLFYCLFPMLSKAAVRRTKIFIGVAVSVSVMYVLFVVPNVPESLCDALIYINPLSRLLDFALGMCAWFLYDKLRGVEKVNSLPSAYRHMLKTVAVALVVITVLLWSKVPQCYALSCLWWPAMFALIIVFALYNSRLLNYPPLFYFGNISFSFYMVHVLCIKTFAILYLKLGIHLPPYAELMAAMAASIAIAALFSLERRKSKNR